MKSLYKVSAMDHRAYLILLLLFGNLVGGTQAEAGEGDQVRWMRGGFFDRILTLDMTKDGTLLATAEIIGLVKIWRVSDGMLLKTIQMKNGSPESLCLSPDGTAVALVSSDAVLRVWDWRSGALLWSVQTGNMNMNVARFAPDGTMIATASGTNAFFWRTADGARLATMSGHTKFIEALDFSPDGTRFITTGIDKSLQVWQVPSGAALAFINIGMTGWSAECSPDNSTVAVGGYRAIRIYRFDDGSLVQSLTNSIGTVLSLHYSSDGSRLAAADSSAGVKLWNVEVQTAQEIWPTTNGVTMVERPLALSADGQTLAFTVPQRPVYLWQANPTPKTDLFIGQGGSYPTAVAPDSSRVAVAQKYRGAVRVFRASDGSPDPILDHVVQQGSAVCFSPDSRLLAVAEGSGVRLWKVEDASLVREFPADSAIASIAFSPDGALLSAAGSSMTAIWRVADGSLQHALPGNASHVIFSPNGQLAVTAAPDFSLSLWNVATAQLMGTLRGHTSDIVTVVFSPSGGQLASGSLDNTIRIWDVASGNQVKMVGDSYTPKGLCYSKDGIYLLGLLGNNDLLDGVMRVWRVSDSTIVRTTIEEMFIPTQFSSSDRLLAYHRVDGTLVVRDNPLWISTGPSLSLQKRAGEWGVRVNDITGSTLSIQTSSDLTTWQETQRFTNPPAALELPLTVNGSKKFFRASQLLP